jgi:hypothetical protein
MANMKGERAALRDIYAMLVFIKKLAGFVT